MISASNKSILVTTQVCYSFVDNFRLLSLPLLISGADSGSFNKGFKVSKGFELIQLLQILELKGLSRQYRPGQTPQKAVSDQGLYCLQTNPAILDTFLGSKIILLKL